jgi:hypothetical protein
MEDFFAWASKGKVFIYEVTAKRVLPGAWNLSEEDELELINLYFNGYCGSPLSKGNWPHYIRLGNERKLEAIKLIQKLKSNEM